jgi:hypothetical protein
MASVWRSIGRGATARGQPARRVSASSRARRGGPTSTFVAPGPSPATRAPSDDSRPWDTYQRRPASRQQGPSLRPSCEDRRGRSSHGPAPPRRGPRASRALRDGGGPVGSGENERASVPLWVGATSNERASVAYSEGQEFESRREVAFRLGLTGPRHRPPKRIAGGGPLGDRESVSAETPRQPSESAKPAQ